MPSTDANALLGSLRRLCRPSSRSGILFHLERVLRVVDRLFGYSGASLTLAAENRTLRYVIATDEAGRSLERAQLAVGDGPSAVAYTRNSPITSADVVNDPRWPGLAHHLHPDVRAVAGVPVRLGRPIGALNVYDAQPRDWRSWETASLQAYASVIAQILDAEVKAAEKTELAGQLQYALDHRIVIERAIGYLMGKHDITAEQAFAGLRGQAWHTRRRVEDLAIELLDAKARPGRRSHRSLPGRRNEPRDGGPRPGGEQRRPSPARRRGDASPPPPDRPDRDGRPPAGSEGQTE